MSDVIISRQSALERLRSPNNLCNLLNKKSEMQREGVPVDSSVEDDIVKLVGRKTSIGDTREIPEELKVPIGVTALVTTSREAGEALGVSHTTAQDISKGLTTRSKFDPELKEKVDEGVENLVKAPREKALDRLRVAMDNITDQKLADGKLRDVSAVAKDMASVFEKLGPKIDMGGMIHFHVHAPNQRQENDYISVEVKE